MLNRVYEQAPIRKPDRRSAGAELEESRLRGQRRLQDLDRRPGEPGLPGVTGLVRRMGLMT